VKLRKAGKIKEKKFRLLQSKDGPKLQATGSGGGKFCFIDEKKRGRGPLLILSALTLQEVKKLEKEVPQILRPTLAGERCPRETCQII